VWSRHSFYWCAVSISICRRARTARLPFQREARAVSFGPTNYEECLHRSEWVSEWATHLHIGVPITNFVSTLRVNHSFKNSKKIASNVHRNLKFWAYFLTPAIFKDSKATSRFSVHSALMTKTDLTFPVSCIRFEDFAVQPFTVCSFHDERRSIYVWQWRDFPWPSAILCALWRNCNLQLQLWQLFYWLINLVINKW